MTFAVFIPKFVHGHLQHKADVRSRSCILRLYFGPLMDKQLAELKPYDVTCWFNDISLKSKVQANGAVSLLRVMYKRATEWGDYNGPDPTANLTRHTRHGRSVVIEEHEMPHAIRTILAQPHVLQTAILSILCTDARPGEVLRMRWASLQFWTERDPKTKKALWHGRWDKGLTKNGTEQLIPLPSFLVEKLRQIPQRSEWVFPGVDDHQRRKYDGPMSYSHFFNKWEEVRVLARIPHVTLHDLRRTGCTYMLNANENLMLVSRGIMNHTNVQTTRRYTKPFDRELKGIMDRHTDRLMRYAQEGGH